MNDAYERFNELKTDANLVCTEQDLNDFMLAGLLFKTGNKYVTRDMTEISVKVSKPKTFNIDLSNIISVCQDVIKDKHTKKIFYMSERCYNKYKECGLIIKQGKDEYYRLFDKDTWLVYIYDK